MEIVFQISSDVRDIQQVRTTPKKQGRLFDGLLRAG
jgi:hypothetical protein